MTYVLFFLVSGKYQKKVKSEKKGDQNNEAPGPRVHRPLSAAYYPDDVTSDVISSTTREHHEKLYCSSDETLQYAAVFGFYMLGHCSL